MKFIFLALLIASCFAEEIAISKSYTDYLKKHVSWEVMDYEDNVFKGWTVDEMSSLFGDHMGETEGIPTESDTEAAKYMPDSFDWSKANCIHPIRSQGSCGSCWAFAVAGVVSDRCCIRGKDHGWLSPQELVSCDKSNGGCGGGDRTAAMRFVEKNNGIVHEACYPYLAKNAPCPNTCADGKPWGPSHVCKCTNVKICSGASGIISCVASGPVAVGMKVYADFMYYKSGIYKWDGKAAFRGYHAIRLVGYGADYWKCANSWGETWGEKGYFMIAKGQCDIESRNPVICDPIP